MTNDGMTNEWNGSRGIQFLGRALDDGLQDADEFVALLDKGADLGIIQQRGLNDFQPVP